MLPTNLTELTAQDLKRLAVIIHDQMEVYEAQIGLAKNWMTGETFERVTAKDNNRLSSLRQLNVLVLNALSLVRERETTLSN